LFKQAREVEFMEQSFLSKSRDITKVNQSQI